MASIQFVMKRVETHLKVMEEDLLERQRVDKAAQIEVTLEQMLGECFPEVTISDDEQFIIFKEGDKEYRFKTVIAGSRIQSMMSLPSTCWPPMRGCTLPFTISP